MNDRRYYANRSVIYETATKTPETTNEYRTPPAVALMMSA